MSVRHSKIQLQVLSLYRRFLRAAQNKPGAVDHVRQEFRKNSSIPRTDTILIEHNIRRAERQLTILTNPSFKSMGVFFQPQPGGGATSPSKATSAVFARELDSVTKHQGSDSKGDSTFSAGQGVDSKADSATVSSRLDLGHNDVQTDSVSKLSPREDFVKR